MSNKRKISPKRVSASLLAVMMLAGTSPINVAAEGLQDKKEEVIVVDSNKVNEKESTNKEEKEKVDKGTQTEKDVKTPEDKKDDKTIVGTVPVKSYKITFDVNGGTGSINEESVKKDEEYKLPENKFTAPEGKEFSHWVISKKEQKSGETTKTEDKEYKPGETIKVEDNLVIKAIWKDKVSKEKDTKDKDKKVEYKITFDANGGKETMDSVKAEKDSSYKLPENKFKAPEGKEFDHWDVNGVAVKAGKEVKITQDTVIKAIWKDKAAEAKKEKYKISFDANGGKGEMKVVEVEAGKKCKLFENKFTAPKGKQFKAWEVDGKEYKVGAEVEFQKDAVLKAVWEDKKPEVNNKNNPNGPFKPGDKGGNVKTSDVSLAGYALSAISGLAGIGYVLGKKKRK